MADTLKDKLSRNTHPASSEFVSTPPRDDSEKLRRTLRDERAARIKKARAFRILPARARAQADAVGSTI